MGKPRMILLIRHAQSEGNKNRDIHQYIPDHRVKLTPDGWQQAEEAGRRLRDMLRPDDTLQFFTSPYRRTRETTEGIIKTLTNDDPEQGPSPFPIHTIKVYEEPRLREQDFGNFQPCSAAMEQMWQERADYGHFFYRIPNGESAADAYDRVSGFNESLWRQFSEPDFPSVCVLVTHGLMTRIFLMKWYHWSVEYFEDLRNINHCEFIVMKQNMDNGKYVLQNELRTWSNYKRQEAATLAANGKMVPPAPAPSARRWGGCAHGCNHSHPEIPHRIQRKNTQDLINLARGAAVPKPKDDYLSASHGSSASSEDMSKSAPNIHTAKKENGDAVTGSTKANLGEANEAPDAVPFSDDTAADAGVDTNSSDEEAQKESNADGKGKWQGSQRNLIQRTLRKSLGGARTGPLGPAEVSDESDWFDTNIHQLPQRMSRSEAARSALSHVAEREGNHHGGHGKTDRSHNASAGKGSSSKSRQTAATGYRAKTEKEKEWEEESRKTAGSMADALGDVDERVEHDDLDDMGRYVEQLKDNDRKSFSEIY